MWKIIMIMMIAFKQETKTATDFHNFHLSKSIIFLEFEPLRNGIILSKAPEG